MSKSNIPITHIIPHLCGMARPKRVRRFVSAFRAFFDESGTDRKKNKALIMGGFFGRVEDWLAASDAWDRCLHRSPRIEYFKHSDMQSLSGQFKRWKRKDADAKMLSLARVLSKFPLLGFCAIAPHVLIAKKPAKSGLVGSRLYDWGFSTAVKMVLQRMNECYRTEKVDFIFDNCSALQPNVDLFNKMKGMVFFDEYLKCAGTCTPGEDKSTAALQMADLLAGEFLRMCETKTQSESFQLIWRRNTIGYMRCDPPWQHIPTLNLLDLGNSIHVQAGSFLKRQREGTFGSPQEALDQFLELLVWHAYFNRQRSQLKTLLESDQEYQDFRKRIIATTGDDPMKGLTDEEE